MQKRTDRFLAKTIAQPKREIGEYVKRNGILVPDIYGSLEDARKSGKQLIVRSEHPQDYSGASGICESPWINNENGNLSWVSYTIESNKHKLKDFPSPTSEDGILKALQLASWGVERHCKLLQIDESYFRKDLTFSLWEMLPGLNLKIFGDSTIEGRYHVTADSSNPSAHGYVQFDKGTTIFHSEWRTKDFFNDNRNKLIDLYETVCNMDKFDPNHRPIIEAQYSDGKFYFLQYHRARDFEPASFILDRPKKKNEIEAMFVRGATPTPEGIVCKVTLRYGRGQRETGGKLPVEDGSFDNHYNPQLINIMAGRRRLQIGATSLLGKEMTDIAVSHTQMSQVCKPQVFVVAKESDFPQLAENKKLAKLFRSGGMLYINAVKKFAKDEIYQLDIHVASDGNKAYLEVLENPLKTQFFLTYGYLLELWKERRKIPSVIKEQFNKLFKAE